jgi:hypothetical protein
MDGRELELLEWVAAARCALTSQVHRRFNTTRSLSTTQRRLKRLADRGLIGRFQLYGGEGGGLSLCCCATQAGLDRLGVRDRSAPEMDDEVLPPLRDVVRTVGWLLALEEAAGSAVRGVLGPGRARIAPSKVERATPADLPLGAGLYIRDFMTVEPLDGGRRPVDVFAAVKPDAVVELHVADSDLPLVTDLLVVRADGRPPGVLALYDHLLAGWWRLVPRYARLGRPPRVVFVCRDAGTAWELAGLADQLLVAAVARAGVSPDAWAYGGRAGIWFADEAQVHRGSLDAWQVPPLPPSARSGEWSLVSAPLLEPWPDAQAAVVAWR